MTAPIAALRREADLALALDRGQESLEAAEQDLAAFVPRAAALQRVSAPRWVVLGGGL